MKLITLKFCEPEDKNFILGQPHSIKSVEDIHEAHFGAVRGIKFGMAFREASGKYLVRWSGSDPAIWFDAPLPPQYYQELLYVAEKSSWRLRRRALPAGNNSIKPPSRSASSGPPRFLAEENNFEQHG